MLKMLKTKPETKSDVVAPLFSETDVAEKRRAEAWLKDRVTRAAKLSPGELLTEKVTMSPVLAEIILTGHNQKNRPLKKQRFVYATAMREGRWRYTSQGISFDRAGLLNNGQNRLTAIVLSGVSVPMQVAFGEDADAYDILDSGASRGGSDTLHSAGFKNTAVLAAAARLLKTVTGSAPRGNFTYPNDIILSVVMENDGLEVAATPGSNTGSKLRCSTAAVTVAFYLISKHSQYRDRLPYFGDRLHDGTDLKRGNPILVVREMLTRGMTGVSTSQKPALSCVAIIKAWNLWVKGRSATPSRLGWAAAEPFPEPV